MVIALSIVRCEFHFVLFFFGSDCIELIGAVLVDDACANFSAIKLAISFSLVAFVFPWEEWFISVDVFSWYFLYKFPNYFWIGTGVHFEMKVLQEKLLASLMVHWILVLYCLYLFRFSDEGFCLNFLRVAWSFIIMSLHSSLNCGLLCFRDIMVLGIVLLAMVMRVLVKCIKFFFLDWYLFLGLVWLCLWQRVY